MVHNTELACHKPPTLLTCLASQQFVGSRLQRCPGCPVGPILQSHSSIFRLQNSWIRVLGCFKCASCTTRSCWMLMMLGVPKK